MNLLEVSKMVNNGISTSHVAQVEEIQQAAMVVQQDQAQVQLRKNTQMRIIF